MFCVKDVAGERYLETFQPGRRYTPISATGDGTWLQIHDRREWTRIEQERHPSPSEAVIDSQSVKSAAMVEWNAGKHQRTEAIPQCRYLGLVLRVLVTAASVGEREGANKCSNGSNRCIRCAA